MSKAGAKAEPKPLNYPFENPSLTMGLAAINATEPPFTVEAKHLETWFKESVIARYMLVDDIRELWNREGFGAVFNLMFGSIADFTLIASCRADREWSRAEGREVASYGVYIVDTAAALYLENCAENEASPARNLNDNAISRDSTAFELPMPEPVLPRYEAQKIYAMIHGLSAPETAPKKQVRELVTAVQSKAIVELLTAHGFTAEDYKGTIPALQQKLTRKGLNGTLTSVDKNSLTAWLKKAGVR